MTQDQTHSINSHQHSVNKFEGMCRKNWNDFHWLSRNYCDSLPSLVDYATYDHDVNCALLYLIGHIIAVRNNNQDDRINCEDCLDANELHLKIDPMTFDMEYYSF